MNRNSYADINELRETIQETTWYHVHNGRLVMGAKSNETALYRATDIFRIVDELEPKEVERVVHAHWNEFSDYTGTCYAECSRCGLLWWIDEGTAEENEMFYCPKCGAKMDEEVSE